MYVLLLFVLIHTVHCEGACGKNYTMHWGVLTSPNYPKQYPQNQNCRWTISTYTDTRISLVFSDFNIEYNRNCDKDSVSIVDGLTNKSLHDKLLCGGKLPDPVVSSGNVVFVYFKSDPYFQYSGFTLEWRVSDTYTVQSKKVSWLEASVLCKDEGGHLPAINPFTTKAIQQVISTNGTQEMWSGKYFTPWAWLKGCFETNSTVIASLIYAEFKNNQMMVCLNHCKSSNHFGLQGTKCLCLDNVEGTPVKTKDKCKKTCPGNHEERCGGGNSITIYMNDVCYTKSSEWNGTISKTLWGHTCQHWATNTPNTHQYHADDLYPDGSVENASNYCRDPGGAGRPWCYTTDPNTRLQWCNIPRCFHDNTGGSLYPCMEFKRTRGVIDAHQSLCNKENDYLCSSINSEQEVTYWPYTDGTTWQDARDKCIYREWSYADFHLPDNTNKYHWIGYSRNVTDVTEIEPEYSPLDCFKLLSENGVISETGTKCVEKNTFVCHHAAIVCGEDIQSSNGSITSPNYPDVYDPFLHCVWTLTVDTGNYIALDLSVDIEESYNCQNDFVKIYEGNSTMKKDLLGSNLCGKNNITVNSITETVTIMLVTDQTVNSPGFIAEWKAVPVPTFLTTTTTAVPATSDKTSGTTSNQQEQADQQVNNIDDHSNTLTGGAVAGIVIGLLVLVAVVVIVVFLYRRKVFRSKENVKKASNNMTYGLSDIRDGQIQQGTPTRQESVPEYGNINRGQTDQIAKQNKGFEAEPEDSISTGVSVNDNVYSFAQTDEEVYEVAKNTNEHDIKRTHTVSNNTRKQNGKAPTKKENITEVYNSLNEAFENPYENKPDDNVYNHLTLSDDDYSQTETFQNHSNAGYLTDTYSHLGGDQGLTKSFNRDDVYNHAGNASPDRGKHAPAGIGNAKIHVDDQDDTYSHLQS